MVEHSVCERHVEIVECIDELEDRVKYLELSDTETRTELKHVLIKMNELMQKIDNFINSAQKIYVSGVGTALVLLVGFIIWYIQNS